MILNLVTENSDESITHYMLGYKVERGLSWVNHKSYYLVIPYSQQMWLIRLLLEHMVLHDVLYCDKKIYKTYITTVSY